MTPATVALLVAAGFGAGLSGSIAGLASLFSYPALLAAGLPPVTANVTNSVALTLSTVGSVASSRPELAGQGRTVLRLAPVCVAGGIAGAALLLLTPADAFEAVVPVLIAAASVVLLLQPRIRAAAQRRAATRPPRAPDHLPAWVYAALFAVGVYSGYFGAAAGVIVLALMLVGLPLPLLRANAVKNVVMGLSNATAAVGFALVGPVRWAEVVPLAAGTLVGSWLGPVVARRLPATALVRVRGPAATGRELRYVPETLEEARASRAGQGEDWEVEGWIGSYLAIATGELAVVSHTIEAITGERPRTLAEHLAAEPPG